MDASPSASNKLIEGYSPRSFENANIMKELRISEGSLLYLYPEDPLYAETKSYSSSDRKRFGQEALRQAIGYKELLQHKNTKNSKLPLGAQLKACNISQEEVVGLEHLIIDDPLRIYQRRKHHVRAVLLKQAHRRISARAA